MKEPGQDLLLFSPGPRVNEGAPDAARDGPGVPGAVQSFPLHPGLPRGRRGASSAQGCALYRENFSPPAGRGGTNSPPPQKMPDPRELCRRA